MAKLDKISFLNRLHAAVKMFRRGVSIELIFETIYRFPCTNTIQHSLVCIANHPKDVLLTIIHAENAWMAYESLSEKEARGVEPPI